MGSKNIEYDLLIISSLSSDLDYVVVEYFLWCLIIIQHSMTLFVYYYDICYLTNGSAYALVLVEISFCITTAKLRYYYKRILHHRPFVVGPHH